MTWGLLDYCLEMVRYLDIEIQFINNKTFNIKLIDWTIIFDHKFWGLPFLTEPEMRLTSKSMLLIAVGDHNRHFIVT